VSPADPCVRENLSYLFSFAQGYCVCCAPLSLRPDFIFPFETFDPGQALFLQPCFLAVNHPATVVCPSTEFFHDQDARLPSADRVIVIADRCAVVAYSSTRFPQTPDRVPGPRCSLGELRFLPVFNLDLPLGPLRLISDEMFSVLPVVTLLCFL